MNITYGEHAPFGPVIFAWDTGQALRLLAQPKVQQRAVTSAIRFQHNLIILHRDDAAIPKRNAVWSRWNYDADTSAPETEIGVTSWMNRLQTISHHGPLFVSRNPARPVPQHRIYNRPKLRHPALDASVLTTLEQISPTQGQNNTWFGEARVRHGHHEDGFVGVARIHRLMKRQYA